MIVSKGLEKARTGPIRAKRSYELKGPMRSRSPREFQKAKRDGSPKK